MLLFLAALASFSASCDSVATDRWNGFLNFNQHSGPSDSIWDIHVTFHNKSPNPVNIYRVSSMHRQLDPMGLIERTIHPGERSKISCMIGDTFTATSTIDDRLLLAHDVARVYVDNSECMTPELKLCKRRPFDASMRWTPPDSFMFTNRADVQIELYFWDGHCEEPVGNVAPGADHHIQSSIDHTFRVRRSDTKQLIKNYTLQEVSITDLDTEFDYEVSEKAAVLFDKVNLKILHESLHAHEKAIAKIETRYKSRLLKFNASCSARVVDPEVGRMWTAQPP